MVHKSIARQAPSIVEQEGAKGNDQHVDDDVIGLEVQLVPENIREQVYRYMALFPDAQRHADEAHPDHTVSCGFLKPDYGKRKNVSCYDLSKGHDRHY